MLGGLPPDFNIPICFTEKCGARSSYKVEGVCSRIITYFVRQYQRDIYTLNISNIKYENPPGHFTLLLLRCVIFRLKGEGVFPG